MNRVKKYIEEETSQTSPKWHIGHLDKEGRPIPLMVWARLLEDMNYRRVGFDAVKYGFRVSTVWLGIDYGFGARKLTFETMVFPPHDMRTLYCKKYGALREATRGIMTILKNMKRISWPRIRIILDAQF